MIAELVSELGALGVEMRVDGDQLRCSASRGTLTPDLQNRIRSHKADIIAFLRAQERASGSGSIPRIPRQNGVRLGLVQQRMWILDRLDPDSTVSNLPGSWRLTGALDVTAFRKALDEVIRRHEILRSRIDWNGETPLQVAEPGLAIDLPLIDLSEYPPAARHAELLRQFELERTRVFDLQTAPLFRARLYKIDAEDHVFFFMPHHVIWDGWSFDILLSELATLYAAFSRGDPSPLPELRTQYADYASWHRDWMESDEVMRQRRFWRDQLRPPLPVLELPTLLHRPAVMSQRGHRSLLPLNASLIDRLRALGRQEGATLFMVLLAAYKAFLHRHTGQADIVVGAPVQDRLHVDADRLIGVFVNTLVLRTNVDGQQSFRALLRRVRDVCVAAYDHQSVPFEQLVEDLQPERSLSHTPLYQTLFTFQETTERPTQFGDLTVSQVHVPTHSAPTDVLFGVMASERSTLGLFDFNADLFAPDAADRFTTGYGTLLQAAVTAPDAPIAGLDVLPPAERARLAFEFNATDAPIPPETSVYMLVERQVARRANQPAIRDTTTRWTYAQLDSRATEIADQLVAIGVGPGDFVAIFLERSVDLIATVLGVWKAGAAYIPIDPEYPRARSAHVLADSGARTIVSRSPLRDALPHDVAASILWLDRPFVKPSPASAAELPAPRSRSAAYLIYTSGSTGLPKGVEVPHRAVANFLSSMADRPGLDEDDVLLAITTLAFDISVLELFLPLCVGAQVVVADKEQGQDGVRLAELMASVRPTVMQATPSTWQMLFDAGWTGSPDLKALCGGETLTVDLARRLASVVGELWNMYGPTETTIWSTCGRVTAGEPRVTIGVPIANTRVYVLDPELQLVPVGVPGELLIGGAGVATGYHARPELTAERFVMDPIRGDGLVYRTGDLVRWLPDGRLEHLGRNDRQIKLNGFRIEPGEIEAAVERLPQVRRVAVVTRGEQENKRLVAYVVLDGDRRLTSTELRRELSQTLPSYMIPALVVPLAELPLTANGKVDYNALLNPLERKTAARNHEPPVGDVETAIAAVWSKLLGDVPVGRHDNFFELGGHSLLSIRAVSAIESELGCRVDPRLFFFQTLHQISAQAKTNVEEVALARSGGQRTPL